MRGSRRRAPRDQRYQCAYIFGAVCLQRDRRPRPALGQRGGDESAPGGDISNQVAAGAHAVLFLDGASYHQEAALELPPNMTLLPLPAYSPELNPAENVWAYLRGNKLANTVYDDYDDIGDKACEAWMVFANDKERVASIATREWAKVLYMKLLRQVV